MNAKELETYRLSLQPVVIEPVKPSAYFFEALELALQRDPTQTLLLISVDLLERGNIEWLNKNGYTIEPCIDFPHYKLTWGTNNQ